METCLVTRLKSSVNNPDLPIFETMQQVTLDAITRGGNMAMTDLQKWALNHFFYAIGAVGNTSTWAKVRTLLIPLIGVDKSHILVDHKEPSTTFGNVTNIIDQPGALEYSASPYNTMSVILNGKDLSSSLNLFGSSILACTSPASTVVTGASSQIGFAFKDSSANVYYRTYNGTGSYISSEIRKSPDSFSSRLSSSPAPVSISNYSRTHIKMYAFSNNNIITDAAQSYGSAENFPDTINTTVYSLSIGSGTKYGIIADFSSALTEEESLRVLDAANTLRNAFVI